MPEKRQFFKGIKGKIILALLLACVSLLTAWSVSKSVFKEMLTTVDNVSAPSSRLALVNSISRNIGTLDQQQKSQAILEPGNYSKIFKASAQLRKLIDSLAILYATDSIQTSRIATIKRLLIERDKQFLNYLLIRGRLMNNKPLADNMKQLSIAVASPGKKDSTILATEQKTSTTTFLPDDQKPRSFLDKIFGKKKEGRTGQSFVIRSEERIKRDTIALAAQDAMIRRIEKSFKNIEVEQRQKNASFLSREADLARVNSKLTAQMLEVLRMVESKVLTQIDLNAIQAKQVVNAGIDTITAILLAFLLITIVLLYLILTDITRSNRYRHDLEIAKDEAVYHGMAKQRFLSNMSHEIRTPLQSIVGYTELIMEEKATPDPDHVQAIHNSSEHLLQIVNEILDYNRIISGKFTFVNEAFHMDLLLDEIITVIKPEAEAKSLQLKTSFELNELGLLSGDAFRLKQVLLNLLANAVKFTDQGEIRLLVKYKKKENDHHFTFTVADTGIGMSEEDSKRIFEEFEQVNASQTDLRRQSGAGLGLTIVKALIESQGGRIYVKSKSNIGSTFTFYLTFAAAVGSAPHLLESPALKKDFQGKVWVVDDDPSILELCGIIFRKAGVDYQCFNSPIALLQQDLDIGISHILMDIRMPGMSGEELCRKIRLKGNRHIKIVAITAQVLPDEHEALLKSGFDALITKPFKSIQLLNVINGNHIDLPVNLNADLGQLKKMTFGDPVLMRQILDQFTKDSEDDSEVIRAALSENNVELTSLVLHRMAGRIAQIGINELSSKFRVMELRLRTENSNSIAENRLEILNLLSSLSHALKMLQKEESNYSIS
ncbi:hybrid sensor histidine kinase/response regulator [Pedobacter sp. PWIIR3]